MRGISTVVATVLILMVVVALAAALYLFSQKTLGSTQEAGAKIVNNTLSLADISFVVENAADGVVYIRNTGKVAITNVPVYANGNAVYNTLSPASIAPGQIGKIYIANYMGHSKNTLKLTSGRLASYDLTLNKSFFCRDPDMLFCMPEQQAGGVAYDLTPYHNDMYLTDGGDSVPPDLVSGGKVESALRMDQDDYVYLPATDSLNFRQKFTAEAWVKTAEQNTVVLWRNYQTGTPNAWQLRISGGIATALIASSGVGWSATASGGPSVSDNNWHHLALTYDNTDLLKIYVDGVMVASSQPGVGICCNIDGPTIIGMIPGYYTNYRFNGLMDEVRIWNRSLTQQEIGNTMVP